MADTHSITEAINAIPSNDSSAAIDLLYERSFERLFAFAAARRGLNFETATDVAHDAFAKTIIRLRDKGLSLRDRDAFFGYLFKSIRRITISRHRSDAAVKRNCDIEPVDPDSVALRTSTIATDPQALAMTCETMERILGGLSAESQQIVLGLICGYKPSELETMKGSSDGYLAVCLRDARLEVQDAFARLGTVVPLQRGRPPKNAGDVQQSDPLDSSIVREYLLGLLAAHEDK